MTEVTCHIASYDLWAAFKLTWGLLILNGLTFGAIAGVVLLFTRRK